MEVGCAGTKAVISLVFAEYMNRVVWNATRSEDSPADIPQWVIQLTALAAIAGVTLLCILTRSLGRRAAVVFTSAKVRLLRTHIQSSDLLMSS